MMFTLIRVIWTGDFVAEVVKFAWINHFHHKRVSFCPPKSAQLRAIFSQLADSFHCFPMMSAETTRRQRRKKKFSFRRRKTSESLRTNDKYGEGKKRKWMENVNAGISILSKITNLLIDCFGISIVFSLK